MKGGHFAITLVSPGSAALGLKHATELSEIADAWAFWPAASSEERSRLSKAPHLLSRLPLSVAADVSIAARALVAEQISAGPALIVADFVHSAVLLPAKKSVSTLVFTHNCEAEIYERHAQQAGSRWMKAVWRIQAAKMRRFEGEALARADAVIAVAERDAERFERDFGLHGVETIPTGVDLGNFDWVAPKGHRNVVFAGSMDSPANITGVEWLLDRVWKQVLIDVPDATMTIVGKEPPGYLLRKAASMPGWRFTGRVADVRPFMAGADAFVIPLLVGGGTRMKAYEAMASGAPVVSTSIGIEGLGLSSGQHFVQADDPKDFAASVVRVLADRNLAASLSRNARQYVEANASHRVAARRFEEICVRVSRLSDATDVPRFGATRTPGVAANLR